MKVDPRAGSKDFVMPLRTLGVTVEEGMLPAGDVEIVGNGPEGLMTVGVEVKTFEDAVACMRNGRFAEQARGMRDYYNVRWLLVYGRIKSERGGLQSRRGERWYKLPNRPSLPELNGWLATMAQAGGMLLWRAEDLAEAAVWLKSLETWWTAKEWEDHRAHLDYYEAPIVGNPYKRPSLAYRVAGVLPGLGSVKARRAAEHFRSARKILLASEKEWAYLEGVGKKMASTIVAAVNAETGAEE